MPRLIRPHIPIEVRCRVILRQIGEMWPERIINDHRKMPGGLSALLASRLFLFATMLGGEPKLHLDHDPPLGGRQKVFKRGVHVDYVPPANDPDHLFYREKHAHHIKTNVHGEHGQHPDRVLIKRERRRERKATKAKVSRKIATGVKRIKRGGHFGRKTKVSWPSRPLRAITTPTGPTRRWLDFRGRDRRRHD